MLNSLKIPRTLVYVRVTVPNDVRIQEVRPEAIPGWDADDRTVSQAFGDRWYDQQRSVILFVPSLAAPGLERHVLVNARHPEFGRLTAAAPRPVQGHPKPLA